MANPGVIGRIADDHRPWVTVGSLTQLFLSGVQQCCLTLLFHA